MAEEIRLPSKRARQAVRDAVDDFDLVPDVDAFVRRVGERGSALAHLCAYEDDDELRERAAVALAPVAEAADASPAAARVVEAAVPMLRRAMRDPFLHDDRKVVIASLLEACGAALPRDETERCFADYRAAAERFRRRVADATPDDMASVDECLRDARLLPDEDVPVAPTESALRAAMVHARTVGIGKPTFAAGVACVAAARAVERGEALDAARDAVDLAASLRTPQAAWMLRALGSLPAGGEIGERARRHAEALVRSGIAPKRPESGRFVTARVTAVDGTGTRGVAVHWRAGDDFQSLSLTCRDALGVGSVWFLRSGGDALLSETDAMEEPLRGFPCDLATVRRVAAHALDRHRALGRPVPAEFLLGAHLLGDEPIEPARYEPDLSAYELDVSREKVAESRALAETRAFGAHQFLDDAAYAWVAALPKRRGRASNREVEAFAAAMAERHRDALARGVALNLEYEAWAGRASDPMNRLAACVLRALEDPRVSFESIPYVLGLARASVDGIRRNLAAGFTSQEQADGASGPFDDLEDGGFASPYAGR